MGGEGLITLQTFTYRKKIPAAFLFTPSIVSSPSNQSKHIVRIMKLTEFFKNRTSLFFLAGSRVADPH
jgi:hypothetical protein